MHHRHAIVLEDLPEKALISGIEKGIFKGQDEILACCLADIANFSVLNDFPGARSDILPLALSSDHGDSMKNMLKNASV